LILFFEHGLTSFQAVPRLYRIGIGDAQRQFVLQQHPAARLQRAEHTTRLAPPIAGLQSAEVGGIGVALAGVAAEAKGLQVAEVVRAALVPWHDVVHLQGPLMQGLPSNSRRRSIRSGRGHG
jgi:hypothetical protein